MSISSGGIIWQPGGGDGPGGGGGGKFQLLAVRCLRTSGTYNMQTDIDAIAAGTFDDTAYSDSGLKIAGEVTHIKRQLIGGGGGGWNSSSTDWDNQFQSLPGAVNEDFGFISILGLTGLSSIAITIGSGGLRDQNGGFTQFSSGSLPSLRAAGGIKGNGAFSSTTARDNHIRDFLSHINNSTRDISFVRAYNRSSPFRNRVLLLDSRYGPGCGGMTVGDSFASTNTGGSSYTASPSLSLLGGSGGSQDPADGKQGKDATSYLGFGSGGGRGSSIRPTVPGGVPGGGGGTGSTSNTGAAGGRGEIRIEFWGMA